MHCHVCSNQQCRLFRERKYKIIYFNLIYQKYFICSKIDISFYIQLRTRLFKGIFDQIKKPCQSVYLFLHI